MIYIFFVIAFLLVIIFLLRNNAKINIQKKIKKLQDDWGIQKTDNFPFTQIEKYFILNKENSFHTLSSQTRNDIDFYELFKVIDRTTSKPGQQYLFDKLNRPTNSLIDLSHLNEQANFFKESKKEREEAQMQLLKLSDDDSFYITSLLSEELATKPKWYWIVIPDIIITLLLVILSPLYPVLLIWLVIPLAVNLGLHYWNKNNVLNFVRSFPQLNKLINVSKKLSGNKWPFDDEKINGNIEALKRFQSKIRLLSMGPNNTLGDLEQIGLVFYELIKGFFLIEVFAFFSIIKELENKQNDILGLFKFTGSIDMALSIASIREGNKKTCLPNFIGSEKKLSASNIYHPLIEKCVPNDITVNLKSILITGSNMSGKTTFLRTIAANSVLAQTIFTCFADSFTTPVVKLSSSIRIDDSLTDGKSYYFEEVNVMSSLIGETTPGHQNIFILDEVFKGTNTIERIAAGKAILSYLNKGNNMVFVSTHDIELSELLAKEYDLYHFTETITDNQLHFNYKLTPGPLKTRNAIKILEISGYPTEIVREAQSISKSLSDAAIHNRYSGIQTEEVK